MDIALTDAAGVFLSFFMLQGFTKHENIFKRKVLSYIAPSKMRCMEKRPAC